jgi:hypothetical protein
MAAGATYEPIATTTLSTTSSLVTFSSISGSYTDLVLITSAKLTSGTTDATIRFNNDTGSNYSCTILSGTGSAASSGRVTSDPWLYIDSYGALSTGSFNIAITNIMNYSNTTTYKSYLTRANNASLGTDAIVGTWRNTSAINRIDIFPQASTFTAGSTFTLYGIAAA